MESQPESDDCEIVAMRMNPEPEPASESESVAAKIQKRAEHLRTTRTWVGSFEVMCAAVLYHINISMVCDLEAETCVLPLVEWVKRNADKDVVAFLPDDAQHILLGEIFVLWCLFLTYEL